MHEDSLQLAPNRERFLAAFETDIEALRVHEAQSIYIDAVEKLSLYFGLSLTTQDMLCIAIGLMKSPIPPQRIARITDILLYDVEFSEKLRYGGRLTAGDFMRVYMILPNEQAYYTEGEARMLADSFGYLFETHFRKVREDFTRKNYRFAEQWPTSETT